MTLESQETRPLKAVDASFSTETAEFVKKQVKQSWQNNLVPRFESR